MNINNIDQVHKEQPLVLYHQPKQKKKSLFQSIQHAFSAKREPKVKKNFVYHLQKRAGLPRDVANIISQYHGCWWIAEHDIHIKQTRKEMEYFELFSQIAISGSRESWGYVFPKEMNSLVTAFPAIKQVSILNSKVSDEALSHLARLPHLNHLDLRGSVGFTPKAISCLTDKTDSKFTMVESTPDKNAASPGHNEVGGHESARNEYREEFSPEDVD